jgi:hypothetical protein
MPFLRPDASHLFPPLSHQRKLLSSGSVRLINHLLYLPLDSRKAGGVTPNSQRTRDRHQVCFGKGEYPHSMNLHGNAEQTLASREYDKPVDTAWKPASAPRLWACACTRCVPRQQQTLYRTTPILPRFRSGWGTLTYPRHASMTGAKASPKIVRLFG